MKQAMMNSSLNILFPSTFHDDPTALLQIYKVMYIKKNIYYNFVVIDQLNFIIQFSLPAMKLQIWLIVTINTKAWVPWNRLYSLAIFCRDNRPNFEAIEAKRRQDKVFCLSKKWPLL